MVGLDRHPLSPREQRELKAQLAAFWYGCSQRERNEYANLLIFLMLQGENTLAPAALEVVIYELITSGTFRLPWSPESQDEFRGSVATAIIEKLRMSGSAKQWLSSYDERAPYGGNFYAWLKKIAYTTAVDLIRGHPMRIGNRKEQKWAHHESLEEWTEQPKAASEDSADSPLQRLGDLRALRKLAERLSQVPPEDWDAFWMHIESGMSYGEIAEKQNSTPEAVRKRIARLRNRLKTEVDP